MILEQKYEANKAEIENICKIAIDKLRTNNGCDITFIYLDDIKNVVDQSSIIYLTVKFNGEYNKIVFMSDVFLDTYPHDIEEEKAGSTQARLILRVAKILFNQYNTWKQNQGLSTSAKLRASTASIISPCIRDSVADIKMQLDDMNARYNDLRRELEELRKLYAKK